MEKEHPSFLEKERPSFLEKVCPFFENECPSFLENECPSFSEKATLKFIPILITSRLFQLFADDGEEECVGLVHVPRVQTIVVRHLVAQGGTPQDLTSEERLKDICGRDSRHRC